MQWHGSDPRSPDRSRRNFVVDHDRGQSKLAVRNRPVELRIGDKRHLDVVRGGRVVDGSRRGALLDQFEVPDLVGFACRAGRGVNHLRSLS